MGDEPTAAVLAAKQRQRGPTVLERLAAEQAAASVAVEREKNRYRTSTAAPIAKLLGVSEFRFLVWSAGRRAKQKPHLHWNPVGRLALLARSLQSTVEYGRATGRVDLLQ